MDKARQDLHTYERGILSLQTETWDKLNSSKDFTQLHKDQIRNTRLSKLDEVGYLLSAIESVEFSKSEEQQVEIHQLETAKEGLVVYCDKLRSQTQELTKLLGEVGKENNSILEKLKERGHSEEEVIKSLENKAKLKEAEKQNSRLLIDTIKMGWWKKALSAILLATSGYEIGRDNSQNEKIKNLEQTIYKL